MARVHLQLPTNFTDILVIYPNLMWPGKCIHLIVRIKTASKLKSTVFANEFQTFATRSVKKL